MFLNNFLFLDRIMINRSGKIYLSDREQEAPRSRAVFGASFPHLCPPNPCLHFRHLRTVRIYQKQKKFTSLFRFSQFPSSADSTDVSETEKIYITISI
jgi:hypothetical protein